ncbi:MAG: TonB-dependent receptor [Ignavibacteriales bacterium]|nr:TonB-dependent receptor [Ignavibacteriales bacterium]
MTSKISIILFLIALLQINGQGKFNNSITAKVIDETTNVPLEFANVVLLNNSDSSQVAGTVTNSEGFFTLTSLKPGNYILKISFIGYDAISKNNISVKSESKLDLGEIKLFPKSFSTDDVIVSEDRAPISYEIDKKVINVSEQITALSGSAVDVLENVPSVTVDIEGNVSLRGSGSFRVLVDGRPTIMESNEILQQMPASSIENIEIITNPSAKYDPEGTAGIINLVLKKNKNVGFSGLAEVNSGLRNKYGGQILGDYKTTDLTYTLGLDYNNRNYFRDEEEINRTTYLGNTTFRNSYGEADSKHNFFGVRGELGMKFSDADYFMVGARYRDREHGSNSTQNYLEWNEADPNKINYLSNSDRSRAGDNYSLYVNYDHKFNPNGHLLKAEVQVEQGNADERTLNELLDGNNNITSGRVSTEKGPETEIETRIDYTLPFSEKSKFEAGYQNEIENSNEITGLLDYDAVSNSYLSLSEYDKDVVYKTNQHSLYSLFASEWKDLGYQFGLRAEYTDREITLNKRNENFVIDRVDFFPSFHTSYKLGGGHEVMASYTRRIERPRGWELEPFETWMDAYNVRIGNPALKPEYIDSYEMGYQTVLGGLVFSMENYYRVNHNKIERLRSVYAENITLSSTDNVGTDYSFGTELMFNFDPIQPWNINLMGNLYNYKIEGVIFDDPFSRESFNWNTRFNNIVRLTSSTRLQFNLMYNSPSVSSQGKREGFLTTNFGIRQDLFNRALSASLQIRDVFGTSKYEYTSEAINYYNYNYVTRESPMVMFNLRFSFNRQGKDREGERGGDQGMDMGGGDNF